MQLNYYNNIEELPIKVWFDIHKTGDFTKLLKNNVKTTNKLLLNLQNAWDNMYDQFMERFGLSDEYMSLLRQKMTIARYQAQYMITGQKHFKTLVTIEKENQRMNQVEDRPIELDKTLAKMSKYYGFKLSSRDLTVSEYYSYIDSINHG